MPDVFVSPEAESHDENSVVSLTEEKPKKVNKLKQIFSPYIFMPDGIRFETQGDGEDIILLLRKHWVTNASWLLMSFILVLLPVVVFPVFSLQNLFIDILPSTFMVLVVLVWYLLTFSYMLVNFLLWYFTVSIVTTERIIDIDYLNILYKEFSATRLSKVEDVTMKSKGFINALFDFGDVHVQTAASEAQFEFLAVPQPDQVVRTINNLMNEK